MQLGNLQLGKEQIGSWAVYWVAGDKEYRTSEIRAVGDWRLTIGLGSYTDRSRVIFVGPMADAMGLCTAVQRLRLEQAAERENLDMRQAEELRRVITAAGGDLP